MRLSRTRRINPVADDVPETLKALKAAGCGLGSSAIFASTCDPPSPTFGWGLVDGFVLSFEHDVQQLTLRSSVWPWKGLLSSLRIR